MVAENCGGLPIVVIQACNVYVIGPDSGVVTGRGTATVVLHSPLTVRWCSDSMNTRPVDHFQITLPSLPLSTRSYSCPVANCRATGDVELVCSRNVAITFG